MTGVQTWALPIAAAPAPQPSAAAQPIHPQTNPTDRSLIHLQRQLKRPSQLPPPPPHMPRQPSHPTPLPPPPPSTHTHTHTPTHTKKTKCSSLSASHSLLNPPPTTHLTPSEPTKTSPQTPNSA